MNVYVQFKDEKKEEVVSWFSREPKEPDDGSVFGEAEVESDIFKKYCAAFPEDIKQAMINSAH
jgi:hypothetical protein